LKKLSEGKTSEQASESKKNKLNRELSLVHYRFEAIFLVSSLVFVESRLKIYKLLIRTTKKTREERLDKQVCSKTSNADA
jgi:hypothetical protein